MNIRILTNFFVSWLLPFTCTIIFIFISINQLKEYSNNNIKLNHTIDLLIEKNREIDTIVFIKIDNYYKIHKNQEIPNGHKKISSLSINKTHKRLNDKEHKTRFNHDSSTESNIFRKYKALYFGGSKSFDSLAYKDDIGCNRTAKIDVLRLNITIAANEVWGGDLISHLYQTKICKETSVKYFNDVIWKPKLITIKEDSIFIDYNKPNTAQTGHYSDAPLFNVIFTGKISETSITGKLTWDNTSLKNKRTIVSHIFLPIQLKIER